MFKKINNDRALHIFHYECILKWVKIQKVCPLCKLTVGYNME